MKVDILFFAFNRLQFTTQTWSWLLAHTNRNYVNKLVVYDDGSEDGTREFLTEAVYNGFLVEGVDAEIRYTNTGSPPALMNHYLTTSEADYFVKIDNDIALPGGWLEALLGAWRAEPEFELVGMEAGMTEMRGRDGKRFTGYSVTDCTHVGGVGLFSVHAIRSRGRIPERGRFGWTEFQDRHDLKRGWITPDLDVPQLDRIPVEPYASLTEQYIAEGWNRSWGKYDDEWCRPYYEWLLPQEVKSGI